ncbi:hypothetical protein PATSB16_38670 [Pandoraea thiooxydans]|nr:hypothetical protein PATSB16_38670 [Pandoraea thiooxydans]
MALAGLDKVTIFVDAPALSALMPRRPSADGWHYISGRRESGIFSMF